MTSAGDEVLELLEDRGWEEREVFWKKGRSRSYRMDAGLETSSFRDEEGWAVRAGDRRRSFFLANTGPPNPDVHWPEADGHGLRLPAPRPVPAWKSPSTLDLPLIGESEARGLAEAIARELQQELPGSRLQRFELEDGSSEQSLRSGRGIRAEVRRRVATLRLEAIGSAGSRPVAMTVVGRDARQLAPVAVARRLADRLAVAERGQAPERDRGEFLLAPEVFAGLLETLAPIWRGPEATALVRSLTDRRGRLGSEHLTLIDDGRFPGGPLEAPVDGEGLPTREVVLVGEGLFHQPLLAWWQSFSDPSRSSGCTLRAGWRDLPSPGSTHTYLRPDSGTSVAGLLGGVHRGYYLLAGDGSPRLDLPSMRFATPVSGFALEGGRAVAPIASAWLTGTVTGLLQGLLGVARDLTFFPGPAGLVGSPSVLVRGLELRRELGSAN